MSSPETQAVVSDVVEIVTEPTLRRLCTELISMRERNDRQHRLFEQTVSKLQDDLQGRFTQFILETQQAYQRLRDEFHAEKQLSLALLNSLVDLNLDLQRIEQSRPKLEATPQEIARWSEGFAIAARRAESTLVQFGVHRYDAVIASAYAPALHERVGGLRVEGMGPHLVARQVEPGYASQQPEFVLRRAKVLISE